MKRWLQHLYAWMYMFPLPWTDYHMFMSVLGDPEEECFTCGLKAAKDLDDLELDKKLQEKYKQLEMDL